MYTGTTASVEHHLKLRKRTVLIILIPASGAVFGIFALSLATYMAVGKGLSWTGAAYIDALGLLMAFGFGWVILRFARRVLVVKTIRVSAGQQLEITTRTRRKFTAKLPDDIRYIIKDGESLTVAVEIDGRRFVMDSKEFSESQQLNEFFQQLSVNQEKMICV